MRNLHALAIAIVFALFAAAPLAAPGQDTHQHDKSTMTCCAKADCCAKMAGEMKGRCSSEGSCCSKDSKMKCCAMHEKAGKEACCKAGEGCCANPDKCCASCKHDK